MKSAYSSGTTKKKLNPQAQKTWRITGGVAIAVCAAMTLFSGFVVKPGAPLPIIGLYWTISLLFFLVAIYCVLLDLRYIRAQFLTDERDLFNENFADDSFRAALVQAQREYQQEKQADHKQYTASRKE